VEEALRKWHLLCDVLADAILFSFGCPATEHRFLKGKIRLDVTELLSVIFEEGLSREQNLCIDNVVVERYLFDVN